MTDTHEICAVDDIPDRQGRGFSVEHDGKTLEFFIVRYGENFYGYINSCPHTGVNLNWQADQFMDITGYQLQCSMHGALFRIRDGHCVYGPCLGRSLIPVKLELEKGRIKLVE